MRDASICRSDVRCIAKRNRKGKGILLHEMEQVTGLDRKTLIRLMNGSLERKPRRKQRERTYGHEVDDAIRVISETLDHICAERLTPGLAWMAQHLASHNEMIVSADLLEKLDRISISTVGRILKRIEQDTPHLRRRRPHFLSRVTRDIPMRVIPWNEKVPGHLEGDSVHHSGPITFGEYVHTIQVIDAATGWSERVAVLGRSYRVMENAFLRIFARIPFPVLEFHPDNGSEFLNDHFVRFLKNVIPDLFLSQPTSPLE